MKLPSEKFKLILEANRVMSSTLNIAGLLRQVIKLAADVLDAETSSILLCDDKTGELYFDLALGDKEAELKRIRLKSGEGIAGWVAEHKEIQVINDAASDPRWAGRADSRTAFNTRSIIAAPLLFQGRLLGVVEAVNKKDGKFSEEDAAILEAFAAQAAVSIENARAFASLEEARKKTEAVFSQMSDGAVFAGEDGEKVMINAAAVKLLGREAGQRATVSGVFEGFEAKPSVDRILAANGKYTPFEFLRKSPKTLCLSGAATKIVNSGGNSIGSVFIFHDATEEKKESLVKKNFLSLMSHKLKTPLVAINGYGPLLLEDPSLSGFQRKALESISRQGNYLLALVEKLLDFTMADAGEISIEKEECRLSAVAESAAASLKHYFDEQAAVIEFKPGIDRLPAVKLDAKKAAAAVRCVLENAVKFNASGGRKAEVGPAAEDGFLGVYVRDNGPGIPPEERDKVFQKFYQIEESFTGQVEGAGLGLALAKQIVEAHGGKIVLESSVGAGSTFKLLFPS